MNFETHNDAQIDVNYSSLRGHVKTTRANLIDVFGKPLHFEEGDKITVEWVVRFDNGIVATIYDWKRYELGTPDLHEIEEYNVGGFDFEALILVREALATKVSLV